MLIECRCGETYPADEKDAGGSLRCRCGRIVQVPSSHGRAEPAMAVARGETREAVSRWLRASVLVPLLATAIILLFPVMGLRLGWRSWLGGGDLRTTLRVVTLNTDGSEAIAVDVPSLVTRWDADIVALQECGEGRRAEISRSRLPARRAAALHSRRRAACVQPRVDRVVPIEPGPKLELCQKAIARSFRS